MIEVSHTGTNVKRACTTSGRPPSIVDMVKQKEVPVLVRNIRRFRHEIGWTQDELGAAIGMSGDAVKKWESGENTAHGQSPSAGSRLRPRHGRLLRRATDGEDAGR